MNRSRSWVGIALLAAVAPGCSNLVVHKVPLDERAEGRDHQQGFRYYLPRPYVAVHDKVLVSERRTLVVLNPSTDTVCFIEGERKGTEVALAKLPVADAGGKVRSVTPEEFARIREGLAAQAPVRPAAATDSTSGLQPDTNTLAVPAKDNIATAPAATLAGKIQIVYLPDMDEQYAVKSRNILAKTAFRLNFKDGFDLVHAGGDHDSTTVAVELLNTVQSAIQAAQTVGSAGIARQGRILKGGDGAKLSLNENLIWTLVETTSLKPGLYRLNKPWESQDGPRPVGCGLLAHLGLPTVVDVALVRPAE